MKVAMKSKDVHARQACVCCTEQAAGRQGEAGGSAQSKGGGILTGKGEGRQLARPPQRCRRRVPPLGAAGCRL